MSLAYGNELISYEPVGKGGWQERGACVNSDPESFFPNPSDNAGRAKKVCRGCEVRELCLTSALENDERWGIWGGLGADERSRLRRRYSRGGLAVVTRAIELADKRADGKRYW